MPVRQQSIHFLAMISLAAISIGLLASYFHTSGSIEVITGGMTMLGVLCRSVIKAQPRNKRWK